MGQGTTGSAHLSTAGPTDQADIDQILMLAARQHSQAAGNRPAGQQASLLPGPTAVPADMRGHAAYQHPAQNPTLPPHATDSPHWGWTAERASSQHPGPEQGLGQSRGQSQWNGPGDSGVAALLASLKGQVVGAQQQHRGHSPGALPSWVVDGQHGHASAHEGQKEHLDHRA